MLRTSKPLYAYFLVTALIPGHLLGWAVEWGYSITIALFGMYLHFQGGIRPSPFYKDALRITLVLTGASVLGYLGTLAFKTSPTGSRDLFDLIRPVLIFYACAWIAIPDQTTLGDLRRACKIVLAFAIGCGLVLILDIPGLSSLVDWVYGETKTGFSEFRARLSIPFENPNFFGLLCILSLYLSITVRSRTDWCLLSLSVVGAALSGSRTAWVTGLLILLFSASRGLAASMERGHLRKALLIVAASVAGFMAAYNLSDDVEEVSHRLTAFVEVVGSLDLSADESYAERIALREHADQQIAAHPLFGIGASKYSELDIVDNQYYGLLVRAGFTGLLLFGYLSLLTVHQMLSGARSRRERIEVLVMALILAVWFWTGSYIENIRVAVLLTLTLYATTHASPQPSAIGRGDRTQ